MPYYDLLTPRELDVMSILWDLDSATVAEVRERLADDLAYTTVLSVLQTLEEKGFVDHEEEGRAYRYRPVLDWRTAGRGSLGLLLRKVFKGSPELLLVQLVSDHAVDEEQLRRLRDIVDQRLADDGSYGDDRASGDRDEDENIGADPSADDRHPHD